MASGSPVVGSRVEGNVVAVGFLLLASVMVAACGLGLVARGLHGPSWLERAALAPAIGWCASTVVTVHVVVAGVAIERWALGWLVFGVSGGMILWWTRSGPSAPSSPGSRDNRAFLGGLTATGLLSFSPLLLGGAEFSVLRGNGDDAFNYVCMADALQRFPITSEATPLASFHLDPMLPLARELLQTRWATSALLGLLTALAGARPSECEFAFSLLALVVAYGPWFVVLRRGGATSWFAGLGAAAICAGGWAALVVDLRAQSHLSAQPALALLIATLVPGAWSGLVLHVLRSLSVAALCLLYPELLPTLLLGGALGSMAACVQRGPREVVRLARATTRALPLTLAALAPQAAFLGTFLWVQLHSVPGHTSDPDWCLAYFQRPLYDRPLPGLWGLGHASARLEALGAVGRPGVLSLKACVILLTGLMAVFALRPFVRRHGPARIAEILGGMLLAGGVQFFLLFGLGRPWAAGKAISFVAPFVMASAVLVARGGSVLGVDFRRRTAVTCVGLWLGAQLIQGIDRAALAHAQREHQGWITPHGRYRQDDPDIHPIVKALDGLEVTVGVFVPDPMQAEYVLGLLPRTVRRVADTAVRGVKWEWVEGTRQQPTEMLIVRRDGASRELSARALARGGDLDLVPTSPAGPGAAPGAAWVVEGAHGRSDAPRVHVFASDAGCWELRARIPIHVLGGSAQALVNGQPLLPLPDGRVRGLITLRSGFQTLELAHLPPRGRVRDVSLEWIASAPDR